MDRNRAALRPLAPLEDPLEYLPCSQVAQYQKGQVIYNQNAPSTKIYLILEGRVKVSSLADRGCQVLVNIYQTEEFFGESAFLHPAQRPEGAIALENTKLMSWTASEVEGIVMRQPRLGRRLRSDNGATHDGLHGANRELRGRQPCPAPRALFNQPFGADGHSTRRRVSEDGPRHSRIAG